METISASEVLEAAGYVKLPHLAIQTVGPAAVTLGAVLAFANKNHSTFASVQKLADHVSLPLRTTQLHLRKLRDKHWLIHEKPPRPRRRTATYTVNRDVREYLAEYAALPLCFRWRNPEWTYGKAWSVRVLYAVIVSWKHIADNLGLEHNDDRVLSYNAIQRKTNFSRTTISNGLEALEHSHLIQRSYGREGTGNLELLKPPSWK